MIFKILPFKHSVERVFRSVLTSLAMLLIASTTYAQPSNDDPCFAIDLSVNATCLFEQFTNANATASTGVPVPGCASYSGGDVWFHVVVPPSGGLAFETQAGVITDGGLAIYSGTCSALTLIECDDDDGAGLMSSIVRSGLTPGSDIFIRVWEFGNDNNGTFGICVRELPPPPSNDDPCFAIDLNVETSCQFQQFTNESAGGSTGVPAPGCAGYSGGDVWFATVVPAGGAIFVNTQAGVMTDGGMAIYSGTCDNLTLIACNDNGPGNGNMPSITQGGLTPGSVVYIRVWENGNNNNGTFSICVTTPPPPPSNDDPCNAISLTTATTCSFQTFTTLNATGTTGVPAPGCANYTGGDVWFQVTVPASGGLDFNTQSGGITDGGMAIYSGTCGALTLIECDDDDGTGLMPQIIRPGLTPGSTIFIRVWEFGNDNPGTFGICVRELPPPPSNDDPCNAITLPVEENCNYQIFTNESAAGSTGVPAPGCAGYSGGDVWFQVTVPSSGNILINTQAGVMTDGGMALYTGSCSGPLTLLTCNDNGLNGNMPSIAQYNLTPGTVIWVRVWENGNNNNGTFGICATIAPPPPIVSTCSNPQPICTGTQYVIPNSIGQTPASMPAPAGGTYGCLLNIPNQHWYYTQITTPGSITWNIQQAGCTGNGIDIDYIVWGPFTSITNACSQISSSNIVSCSFSAAATENINIPNGALGSFYIVLITNYGNTAGNYSIVQTSGAGGAVFPECNAANVCNMNVTNSGPVCGAAGGTQNITLQTSTVTCASNYAWSGPGGFTSSGQNTSVNLPTTPGSYTYTVTASFAGLGATCSATTTVVVETKPDLGNDKTVTICSGGTADLTTQFNTTGLTANWTFNNNPVANPASVTDAGIYQLIVANAANCKDTALVTVSFSNVTGTATATNATCTLPGTIEITAATGTSPFTYFIDAGTPQAGNQFPAAVGAHTFTITDNLGCTFTDNITVDLTNDFVLSVIEEATICNGQSVTLTTTGTATGYTWTPAETLDDASSANPVATPTETTQYQLTATYGICDPLTYTVDVTVLEGPEIDAGLPQTIQQGEQAQLNATATGATGFEWNASSTLSTLTSLTPIATPEQTTMYYLTATNSIGCTSTDSVLITVIPQCIKIRNAFSPNGDGINDLWKVYDSYDCLKNVSVHVFNRYGSKVFEARDYRNTWNGTYNNKPVPDGTYYAVVDVLLNSGKRITYKSDVTIVR